MDDECDERIRSCADGEASNAPEVQLSQGEEDEMGDGLTLHPRSGILVPNADCPVRS